MHMFSFKSFNKIRYVKFGKTYIYIPKIYTKTNYFFHIIVTLFNILGKFNSCRSLLEGEGEVGSNAGEFRQWSVSFVV